MSSFGLSDSITMEMKAKAGVKIQSIKLTKQVRDLRPSKRHAMRSYLQQVDVFNLIDLVSSCAAKVKC